MANNKRGFDYYNIKTDRYLDIRIKRLKREYKCDGIAIYDYILCEIYRVKGYYVEWSEHFLFDIDDYFGITEKRITEIVKYCTEIGLFNKEVFEKNSIVTSQAIQNRFLEMSKRAKRLNYYIDESINLTEEVEEIQEVSQQPAHEEIDDSIQDINVEALMNDKNRNFKALVEKITQHKILGENQQIVLDYTNYGELGNKSFSNFLHFCREVTESSGRIHHPERFIMKKVAEDMVSVIKN
jgi:hypothetical protein